MLVCLLGLWQGTGWAATYSYCVDGYEYESRDYTKKYARLTNIPNTETVRIPADVTYNGVVYPLTKIRSGIKSDNVKDIYFTRVLPTMLELANWSLMDALAGNQSSTFTFQIVCMKTH